MDASNVVMWIEVSHVTEKSRTASTRRPNPTCKVMGSAKRMEIKSITLMTKKKYKREIHHFISS